MRFILAVVAASLLLGACSSGDCSDNRNSLPLAGFFSSDSETQPVAISRMSVYGIGAPGDSMLIYDQTGVEEVYLPFSIDRTSTSFVLDFLDAKISDTVTFNYDLSPRFASSECGVVYDYHITSITHTTHLIDSVTCPAGVITNTPGRNINIYLRTLSNP